MKNRSLFLLLLLLGIAFRLKFGVYQHDEFVGESHLFVKHRMIWKWSFYSPLGMSDLTLEELSEKQKEEQLLFNEFVSKAKKIN